MRHLPAGKPSFKPAKGTKLPWGARVAEQEAGDAPLEPVSPSRPGLGLSPPSSPAARPPLGLEAHGGSASGRLGSQGSSGRLGSPGVSPGASPGRLADGRSPSLARGGSVGRLMGLSVRRKERSHSALSQGPSQGGTVQIGSMEDPRPPMERDEAKHGSL